MIFLMYHELQLHGRPLCQSEEGYVRYVVSEDMFRRQLSCLRHLGLHGISVTEALAFAAPAGIAITFDDGCETDLVCVAPLLKQENFNATFYVTVGFVGRHGYLSVSQLLKLSNLGFEIGCHSMTHAFLTDLPSRKLHSEMVEAKQKLEQMIGRSVEHFSCPGGRFSRKVAEVARAAGYRSLATSHVGSNSPARDPFSLTRVPVMRGTSLATFERLCRGKGLWQLRVSDFARTAAKTMLGNSTYDKMRSALLTRTRPQ
jgi:peptidoglycan/xylan/chitin deacetylase (PgdA/CDA1 family)